MVLAAAHTSAARCGAMVAICSQTNLPAPAAPPAYSCAAGTGRAGNNCPVQASTPYLISLTVQASRVPADDNLSAQYIIVECYPLLMHS